MADGVARRADGQRRAIAVSTRPRIHPLHVGIDRHAEGRDAHARNAISFVDWCSSVFTPAETDRFSSHAPFHFDLSILDIYVSLKHGATLFLISEELGKKPEGPGAIHRSGTA